MQVLAALALYAGARAQRRRNARRSDVRHCAVTVSLIQAAPAGIILWPVTVLLHDGEISYTRAKSAGGNRRIGGS